MTRKPSLPLVLLAIMGFLAPIIGGQLSQDLFGLPLGFADLLSSVFGSAITQRYETPLLSHFVLAALASGALIATVARRKILQLPWTIVSGALLLFFGLLVASVALSNFRWTSMWVLAEWLSYGVAFFAVVTSVGRQRGVYAVLAAMFAACVLLAIWGLRIEYPAGKLGDPGYRLFLGWVNPNAAGGMMSIGLLVGIGLLATRTGLERLLCAVGCVAVGAALVLTFSKGALLATLLGAAIFLVLTLAWTGAKRATLVRLGLAAGCGALALVAAYAIQFAQRPKADAGPAFGRLSQAAQSSEQSEGFRKMLYEGAKRVVVQNPVGYGIGTYRYEGARAGITTPTVFAHNNYYQLAVETGLSVATPLSIAGFPIIVSLTGILLCAAVALWLFQSFRGARSLPSEQNTLRAAVVAAVVATVAHGMLESNLYYYGIGLTFFVLLGIGLLLSTDAVAPEFTPIPARAAIGVAASMVALQLGYSGYVEAERAHVRWLLSERDQRAIEAAQALTAIAPTDGESWMLASHVAATREEALRRMERAVRLAPSIKNQRAIAREYMANEQAARAMTALQSALIRDPNNLDTLGLALDFARQMHDDDAAEKMARRLVEVESTKYYQVRSQPELVPTKTAEARVYLASRTKDPAAAADLLQGAVDVYLDYAARTVPNVIRFGKENLQYLDQDVDEARAKLAAGKAAATRLAELYRSIGADDKVRVAETSGSTFDEVAGALGGPNK